ncbi:MAG: YggU family protein [Nitrospirae bacterium]|nr:YggU family protein [Nitrospirota bacterium]
MPDIPPLDLRETKEGVVLRVSVKPKAFREEVVGFHDGALRLRLTAPPTRGAANEACRTFLAELFQISRSRIQIIRGDHSRQKWIQIQGLTSEMILKRLTKNSDHRS